MPTYITLASFTDQGVRNAKDSPKRAEAFKELAKKHGVTVKDIYWTQGRYDIVTITESPDDMAATALSLSIAALGKRSHGNPAGVLWGGHADHHREDGLARTPEQCGSERYPARFFGELCTARYGIRQGP